jgi:hypothetical protein
MLDSRISCAASVFRRPKADNAGTLPAPWTRKVAGTEDREHRGYSHPRRLLHLRWVDRALFVWLYRRCPRILDAITIVRPETVVRWHRMGFAAYWRWKSRPLGGRPRIGKEVRDLMRRMSFENPLWGAPKIHGELLKLGIEVAQSTVSIYMGIMTPGFISQFGSSVRFAARKTCRNRSSVCRFSHGM